jgi:hypothetical protein
VRNIKDETMRNIVPSRALVRRSHRLLELAFVVVTAGIFLAVVGIALYVVPLTASGLFQTGRALLFFGGIGLGITGVAMAVRAVTWKVENDLARMTGEALSQHLDRRFTLIRNISKRTLGYIDAVLVGPPGVLVFRIVELEGHFLNEGGKWLKLAKGGKWRPMFSNPSQEAIDDIKSLREYLERRDLVGIPIFSVVVFVTEEPFAQLILKEPHVPVAHLSGLYERLQRNYLAKDRISPDEVEAIVRLLYDR